jgi:hypothetical protein
LTQNAAKSIHRVPPSGFIFLAKLTYPIECTLSKVILDGSDPTFQMMIISNQVMFFF